MTMTMTMTMTKDTVGYRMPPTKRRFKKGQSGNPKGRPKGSRNLTMLVQRELNAPIEVTEKGKTRRIRRREAVVKTLVNDAIRGKDSARKQVVDLDQQHDCSLEGERDRNSRSETDEAILQRYFDRTRGRRDDRGDG